MKYWAFAAFLAFASCGTTEQTPNVPPSSADESAVPQPNIRPRAPTPQPTLLGATSAGPNLVLVQFSQRMSSSALTADAYTIVLADTPDVVHLGVQAVAWADPARQTTVVLTTDGQEAAHYHLRTLGVLDAQDQPLSADGGARFAGTPVVSPPRDDAAAPRIVGAASIDPTTVLVQFSKPMAAGADDPLRYVIVREDDLPEAVQLPVDAARFVPESEQRLVELTTAAQEERWYGLRAVGITDRLGQAPPPAEWIAGVLVDPATARFAGTTIDPGVRDDVEPPRVVGAISLDPVTVRVQFSKPMGLGLDVAANFEIEQLDDLPEAIRLPVERATPVAGDPTRVDLTTRPQGEWQYALRVIGVVDRRGTPIAAPEVVDGVRVDPARTVFVGTPEQAGPRVDETPPRVVGALATSNTTVRVHFSKSMGDLAVEPESYSVVQANINPEAGALSIVGARFLDGTRRAVELTTLSQSAVEYDLLAIAPTDVRGLPMAAPQATPAGVIIDPRAAAFWGAGAVGAGVDSDGDGLSDAEEQRGWVVQVRVGDRVIAMREVTADPFVADTDGDGLSDAEERRRGLDPRDVDTDDDQIDDRTELSVWFSSPASPDSDADGINDRSEIDAFQTSPIQADTDGDGFTDGEEVAALDRNPRLADLPRLTIDIGDVALRLDTRFTITDVQGQVRATERTGQAIIARSEQTGYASSDTNVFKWNTNARADFEFSQEQGFNNDGFIADYAKKFKQSFGVSFGFAGERTVKVDRSSARTAQRTYQDSLKSGETISATETVQRSVSGASVETTVRLRNAGDVAFTVRNLEISALLIPPGDAGELVPIGALVPSAGNDLEVAIGPLDAERGPFVFSSREVFPALVEDLLRDPRGIIFRVANFDLVDEHGRNFAFVQQQVNDRTAGLTIDYGNGAVERFRVATAGRFENGRPAGITLGAALRDILQLESDANQPAPDAVVVADPGVACGASWAEGDDVQLDRPRCPAVDPGAVLVTVGVNGVLDTVPRGDDIIVVPPNGAPQVVDGGDGCFHSAPLVDDVIAARTPAGDLVVPACAEGGSVGMARGVMATPGADGILDTPSAGTDRAVRLAGYGTEDVGRCPEGAERRVDLTDTPCNTDDACGDGACVDRRCDAGSSIVRDVSGADCRVDAECGGDRCEAFVQRVARIGAVWDQPNDARFWAFLSSTDDHRGVDFENMVLHAGDELVLAYVQDRDGDGLFAREEFVYGSSDRRANSDGCPLPRDAEGAPVCPPGSYDNLSDLFETKVGWTVEVDGQPTYTAYSDPASPDSDADGLTDDEEFRWRTDPRKQDTDGDGISDYEEVNGYAVFDRFDGTLEHLIFPYGPPRDAELARGERAPLTVVSDCAVLACTELERCAPADADWFGWDPMQAPPNGAVPAVASVHCRSSLCPPVLDDPDQAPALDDCPMRESRFFSRTEQRALAQACRGGGRFFTLPANDVPAGIDGFVGVGHRARYASDPLAADTDADSLPDGIERRLGGNPNDPLDAARLRDTDRDGLPDGFEADGLFVGPADAAGDCTILAGERCDADTLSDQGCDGGLDAFGLCVRGRRWCIERGNGSPCQAAEWARDDATRAPVCFNRLSPDSDDDRLPDLLEFYVGSDPLSADSDGDGLTDAEEFDPQSPLSISRAAWLAFETECARAEACRFDPADWGRIGSSLTHADTDRDGIDDWDEVRVGWVVRPCTVEPFEVFSDPTHPDRDNDGWSDAVERAQGTDPNDADTDDDRGQIDALDPSPLGCGTKVVRVTFAEYLTGVERCFDVQRDFVFDLSARVNLAEQIALLADEVRLEDAGRAVRFDGPHGCGIVRENDTVDVGGVVRIRTGGGRDLHVWELEPTIIEYDALRTQVVRIRNLGAAEPTCISDDIVNVLIEVSDGPPEGADVLDVCGGQVPCGPDGACVAGCCARVGEREICVDPEDGFACIQPPEAVCQVNADCVSTCCVAERCAEADACALGLERECERDEQCASGCCSDRIGGRFVCRNENQCEELLGLERDCERDEQCASGCCSDRIGGRFVCRNENQCEELLGLERDCERDEQCASGCCSDRIGGRFVCRNENQCEELLGLERDCERDEQCASGCCSERAGGRLVCRDERQCN